MNRENPCQDCGNSFACADPKTRYCSKCRGCRHCDRPTRSKTRTCRSCRTAHPTDKQRAQVKRMHLAIRGDNNPSKRPEVRLKLSLGKLGDLNPARIHRAQFAAHIAKYRPGKVSKLENSIAPLLLNFKHQRKVGPYRPDFANFDERKVVEVQGCWWHSCQLCFPGSPTHAAQMLVAANFARKREYLLHYGWKIIEVWEHEIRRQPIEAVKILLETRIS